MNKEIKVSVTSDNNLFLEEDAKRGDIINLNKIREFNFSFVKEQIHERIEKIKNDELQKLWEKEKRQIIQNSKEFIERDNKIKDLERQVDTYGIKLENLKENIKKDLVNKDEEIIRLKNENEKEIELAIFKKSEELKAKIYEKESELKELQREIDNRATIESLKKFQELRDQKQKEVNDIINQKQQEIDKLKIEIKINDAKIEAEILKAIYEKEEEKNKEIAALKEEHSQKIELIKSRGYSNIKIEGNDFENYLQSEFDKNLSWMENITFEKITKSGQKADFIFTVYNDNKKNILTSVVIEAKTEIEDSQYKKKNSDHYKKLSQDCKNMNGEYALLVSTLEIQDEFIFKKVNEYDKMYVVRPQFFTSFLSLIYSLAQKQKEIKLQEANYKTKKEINELFEKMKRDILEKTINNIEKNLTDATKQVENIQNAIDKIRHSLNIVNTKHIQTLINKIERFEIKKITKKLDDLIEIKEDIPSEDISSIVENYDSEYEKIIE